MCFEQCISSSETAQVPTYTTMPSKIVIIEGKRETYLDKRQMRGFIITTVAPEKILEGITQTKEKDKYTEEAAGQNKSVEQQSSQ